MTFISLYFYIFVIAVVFLFFIIPKKFQWCVLLLSSFIFYASYGVEKIIFILASVLITFFSTNLITNSYDKCESKMSFLTDIEANNFRQKVKEKNRIILLMSIVLIILFLMYVKIGKFVVDATNMKGGSINIIVPLGISYYTFSLIGYIADCYYKKDRAEKDFLKLFLYAIYFPKILQGPISKHKTLAPQLLAIHKFDYKNLCYGLQLMLYGYFKKMVIADRLAIFVNTVFEDYYRKSGSMLLLAAVFSSFQLYCDFSGCMDIACGFSEILGIDLDKNFNRPFFSKTPSEFWRRWHITLGIWFKDYVYMPITVSSFMTRLLLWIRKRFGKTAAKNIGIIIPLSVVWILTGFWHGTGINYCLWGIYWGLLIICEMLFKKHKAKILKKLSINTDSVEYSFACKLKVFFLFTFGRIITMSNDLNMLLAIVKSIFFKFNIWELFDGTVYRMGLDRPDFIAALIFLTILFKISRYEEKIGDFRDFIAQRQIVVRWIILYMLIFSIIIFGIYGIGYNAGDFVYMNF